MVKTVVRIGPGDHGRRMALDEFDRAEVEEGYLYELSRGAVAVSDVPGKRHLAQVRTLKKHLFAYDLDHPGVVHDIASGSECKILLPGLESERHPDLSVYLVPPPEDEGELWARWVPAVVIEVVSPSSRARDYGEKREEYLAFGVDEYWIVDADERKVVVLRRSGKRWVRRTVRPPKVYQPPCLPDFALDCGAVFAAAADAAE